MWFVIVKPVCCRAQNLYPVTVDEYELVEVVGKGASATVSISVQLAATKLKQPVPLIAFVSYYVEWATMLQCSKGTFV